MKSPAKQVVIGHLPLLRVTRTSIILPRVPWGPKGTRIVDRAIPKLLNLCRSGQPYRGTIRNWLSQFLDPRDLLRLDIEFLGSGFNRCAIGVFPTRWSSQDHVEKFDELRVLGEFEEGGKTLAIDLVDLHGLVARVQIFRKGNSLFLSEGSKDPSNFMLPPIPESRRIGMLTIATSAKRLD